MKARKGAILAAGLLVSTLLVCPAYAAFTDVPESHWAAADIQYVAERGLFNGTSATTFDPNANMDRAMLATVLYRYAGSPAVSGVTPYVDMTAGQWYTDAVIWAYQNGIFPETTLDWKQLSPTENVRRAEFAIMLYNFSKTLDKASCDASAMEQHPFTDMGWDRFSFSGFGPIYNESVEAMLGWAWPNGIMTGNTETTINPLGTITRAEVAAMLSRFDKTMLGGTAPTVTIPPTPEPEPSPDPGNQYEGYTLTNGKPLTEENVSEFLWGLMDIYPIGTTYETPYRSTSAARGPYSSGVHCAGWAMLCSDAVFGDLPWIRMTNPDWGNIRPGDLVEYDNWSTGHVVVVIEKTDEYIIFTDSTTNNKTYWGGQYFRWWLEEQPGYTLYTRYPQ